MTEPKADTSANRTAILGAMIGAMVGSLGAVLLAGYLGHLERESSQRAAIVQGYVYHIQDAAEALAWRLHNAGDTRKVEKFDANYLAASNLYALARMVAAEHLLLIDGYLPELTKHCKSLSEMLTSRHLGAVLGRNGVPRYTRVSLAELLLVPERKSLRLTGFTEFRVKIGLERGTGEGAMASARSIFTELGANKRSEIEPIVVAIARAAAECSGLPADVPKSV